MQTDTTAFPFPRHQPCKWSMPLWWRIGAKLFGQRFDDFRGPWHCTAYWWRGTLYIAKYK